LNAINRAPLRPLKAGHRCHLVSHQCRLRSFSWPIKGELEVPCTPAASLALLLKSRAISCAAAPLLPKSKQSSGSQLPHRFVCQEPSRCTPASPQGPRHRAARLPPVAVYIPSSESCCSLGPVRIVEQRTVAGRSIHSIQAPSEQNDATTITPTSSCIHFALSRRRRTAGAPSPTATRDGLFLRRRLPSCKNSSASLHIRRW
jgi:hypothetical protein